MNEGIIDSSILIDALRGRPEAVRYVTALVSPMTHLVAAAELFAGARDKPEQDRIESFLQAFQIISPTEADALAALDFYKRYHLSHGVDWPDCQIAATAMRLGIRVQTLNIKHFTALIPQQVSRPY